MHIISFGDNLHICLLMFVVKEYGLLFDYLLENQFEIYEVCQATKRVQEVFD